METMRKDRDKTIEKLQRVIEQCIEDRRGCEKRIVPPKRKTKSL